MKKTVFILALSLVVASGLISAHNELKGETPVNAAKKAWEASPEGIAFKKWEASTSGKKVYAAEAKIRKSIREFSNMNAVVTSLILPQGSRLGYGVMVKMNGENYILAFGIESKNEFDQLRTLKVNDNIMIKSHNVSHAPKYAYPIVAGDYIVHNGKLIYKRIPRKGGC